MIPTDVPLAYRCAAGHRMRWSRKGYRHVDNDEQDACGEPCVGAVPVTEVQNSAPLDRSGRPKLVLIKGGQ